MKIKSKALLLALCAVLLVAASVLTTLAFLTATDKVDNAFTVGNVTLGDKLQNGIDEAKVNENGQPLKKDEQTGEYVVVSDKAQADRVKSNEYKLQPGKTYTKDPTIHVASISDPCFLFVKIDNGLVQTINGTSTDIEAAQSDDYDTIAEQMEELGWKKVESTTDTKIVDGVYVYVGTTAVPAQVAGGQDKAVFNEFKIDGSIDGTTLDKFDDKKITVTAYAVQASGFEDQTAVQIITAAFPQLLVPEETD